MENRDEQNSLRSAINSIKLRAKKKGNNVTEEDIAKKLNLSSEQLRVCANGKDNLAENLVAELLASYGLKRTTVCSYEAIFIQREPISPEDEVESNE